MAFGSLGGDFRPPLPGTSAQFINLHGQLYHRVSSLEPAQGHLASYGQLYIVDSDLALAQRLEQFEGRDCDYRPTLAERPIIRSVYFQYLILRSLIYFKTKFFRLWANSTIISRA